MAAEHDEQRPPATPGERKPTGKPGEWDIEEIDLEEATGGGAGININCRPGGDPSGDR